MLVILIVILIYSKKILLIKNSPIIFKTIMVLYNDIKKKSLTKFQIHILG